MKKLSISLVLICFSLISFSQNYFKFPTSDAVWNYKIAGRLSPPYECTVIDSLGQPITIGSHQYFEVYEVQSNTASPSVIGAIREDTISNKVYFNYTINETVLYDFSLAVGDTIHYSDSLIVGLPYYKTVESIDSIYVNGQYRKRWHLKNHIIMGLDIWIEGIGSVYRHGLLEPLNPDYPTDGSTCYFGCFKHDKTIYTNDTVCGGNCCPCSYWLVSIKEIESDEKEIVLYPNPTKNKLKIDLQKNINGYESLELISLNGQLIRKQDISSKEEVILNLESLETGNYIIKLIGKENVIVKKISVIK